MQRNRGAGCGAKSIRQNREDVKVIFYGIQALERDLSIYCFIRFAAVLHHINDGGGNEVYFICGTIRLARIKAVCANASLDAILVAGPAIVST